MDLQEHKLSKHEREKVKRKIVCMRCLPDCVKSTMKKMEEEDALSEQKNGKNHIKPVIRKLSKPSCSSLQVPDTQGYTKVSVKREPDFTKFYIYHLYQVQKVIVPEENMTKTQFHVVSEPPFLGLYLGNKEFYPLDEHNLTVTDDDVKHARGQKPVVKDSEEEEQSLPRVRYENINKPHKPKISFDEEQLKQDMKEHESKPKRRRKDSPKIHVQKWNSHENAYSSSGNEDSPRHLSKPDFPQMQTLYRVYSQPTQSNLNSDDNQSNDDYNKSPRRSIPSTPKVAQPVSAPEFRQPTPTGSIGTPEYYRNVPVSAPEFRHSIPTGSNVANAPAYYRNLPSSAPEFRHPSLSGSNVPTTPRYYRNVPVTAPQFRRSTPLKNVSSPPELVDLPAPDSKRKSSSSKETNTPEHHTKVSVSGPADAKQTMSISSKVSPEYYRKGPDSGHMPTISKATLTPEYDRDMPFSSPDLRQVPSSSMTPERHRNRSFTAPDSRLFIPNSSKVTPEQYKNISVTAPDSRLSIPTSSKVTNTPEYYFPVSPPDFVHTRTSSKVTNTPEPYRNMSAPDSRYSIPTSSKVTNTPEYYFPVSAPDLRHTSTSSKVTNTPEYHLPVNDLRHTSTSSKVTNTPEHFRNVNAPDSGQASGLNEAPEDYRNMPVRAPDLGYNVFVNSDGEKWVKISPHGSMLSQPDLQNVGERNMFYYVPERSLISDKPSSPSFQNKSKAFDPDLLRIQSEIFPLKKRLAALRSVLSKQADSQSNKNFDHQTQTHQRDFSPSSKYLKSSGSQTLDHLKYKVPNGEGN